MRKALGRALVLLLVPALLDAQEFRTLRPLRRDRSADHAGRVDQAIVRHALESLFEAWNTPGLRSRLGSRFQDGSRLADTLATIPRDARLRLLAIESMRPLRERTVGAPPGDGERRVTTTVSVFARTQVEFEDPTLGFQRLEGVNEYILDVTVTVEP